MAQVPARCSQMASFPAQTSSAHSSRVSPGSHCATPRETRGGIGAGSGRPAVMLSMHQPETIEAALSAFLRMASRSISSCSCSTSGLSPTGAGTEPPSSPASSRPGMQQSVQNIEKAARSAAPIAAKMVFMVSRS